MPPSFPNPLPHGHNRISCSKICLARLCSRRKSKLDFRVLCLKTSPWSSSKGPNDPHKLTSLSGVQKADAPTGGPNEIKDIPCPPVGPGRVSCVIFFAAAYIRTSFELSVLHHPEKKSSGKRTNNKVGNSEKRKNRPKKSYIYCLCRRRKTNHDVAAAAAISPLLALKLWFMSVFPGAFPGSRRNWKKSSCCLEETGKKSIDSWTMGFKLIAGFGGKLCWFFLMETARKFFIRFVVVVRKICFCGSHL